MLATVLFNLVLSVDQRPFVRLARGLGELWLAVLLVFVAGSHGKMVEVAGIEPAAPWFQARMSTSDLHPEFIGCGLPS
jgi:hypothetical protein